MSPDGPRHDESEEEHDSLSHPELGKSPGMVNHQLIWDKAVALSFYSMVGESIRVLIGNLLGLACHQPGTVQWNKTEWAPCMTAPGNTSATGGALFTDLPANMLGCFLMGLFTSGHDDTQAEKLPVHTNLCFLKRHSRFQSWTVTHFAIRTGLSGSLTTFSSWNAQMVVMICAGEGTELGTQWVSALFGYCVGWMVALQSYYLGTHVASLLHRCQNPDLAQEADLLHARQRNVRLNRDLPDIERRYLYDLTQQGATMNPSMQAGNTQYNDAMSSTGFHHLKRWKEQTHRHRYQQINEGGSFLQELHDIERIVLIEQRDPDQELLEVANNAGWDVEALKQWQQMSQNGDFESVKRWRTERETEQIRIERWVNSGALIVAAALLIWGIVEESGSDAASLNYRSSFLATLLAPLGTLARWGISYWNGSIQTTNWQWFPIGTFVSNMLGCCISSLMLAILLQAGDTSDLTIVLLGAFKTGFAGSLSTVSTFVVEMAALLRELPQHAWGYYYLALTLTTACTLGVIFYAWAV